MKDYKEELKRLQSEVIVDLVKLLKSSPIEDFGGCAKFRVLRLKGNINFLGGKLIYFRDAINSPLCRYELCSNNGRTKRITDADIYLLVAITEELKELAIESKHKADIYSQVLA